MDADELKVALYEHVKWLNGDGGTRADLHRADLSWASLSVADLRGADLRGATLRGADLRGADLSGATLRGADLRGADLSVAGLRGADLSVADLRGADLRGADLSGAKIMNCIGDGKIIRSMQAGYIVTVCDDLIQIGCKGFRAHEWADFDDDTISNMDNGALDWWKSHKALVFAFLEAGE